MSDYFFQDSNEVVDKIVLKADRISEVLKTHITALESLLEDSKDKDKLEEIILYLEFDLIDEGARYEPVLFDLFKVFPAVYQEPIEKFEELFEKSKSIEEDEFYYAILNYRISMDNVKKLKNKIRFLENRIKAIK